MGKVIAAVCLFLLAMPLTAEAQEQKVCPVMEGNPIKSDIYVDYEHVDYGGKRVYFCCPSCKQEFTADPGKYLSNLPQFSRGGQHLAEHQHGPRHFTPARLIGPMGIATSLFLAATLLSGLFIKKNRKLFFPWHKRFALFTVLSAFIHVALILVVSH